MSHLGSCSWSIGLHTDPASLPPAKELSRSRNRQRRKGEQWLQLVLTVANNLHPSQTGPGHTVVIPWKLLSLWIKPAGPHGDVCTSQRTSWPSILGYYANSGSPKNNGSRGPSCLLCPHHHVHSPWEVFILNEGKSLERAQENLLYNFTSPLMNTFYLVFFHFG